MKYKIIKKSEYDRLIRKKANWIYHDGSASTGWKAMRECSNCKVYFPWLMPRNSYCPNCGAEMH